MPSDTPTPAEIDRLAEFIIANVPSEPSRSEGAVDTAMRVITEALATIQQVRELADKWEREAGPGSRAEQAYGRQVVSVEFAVTTLRRILGGES
jgi:hypothetical protein